MTDGVGSENYSYNNLGMLTQLQKVIGTTTYTTGYQYNLAGELTQITYPSYRVAQQSVDTIGRLSSITDTFNSVNTTWASGFVYNAASQVTGFNYGNGVAAAFGYTQDRLLLQTLAYTKGSTTLFSANYWYKTDSTNCPSAPAGNNGQITGITDSVDGTRSTTIVYDAWNRIKSWSNAQAAITETYDRYGNRLTQSLPVPSNVTVDTNTNHITTAGYAYDAAGNMTNDSINVLTYDGENRVVTSTQSGATYTYSYDGNGLRVEKTPPAGSAAVYIFSGAKVIAEYTAGAVAGSPSTEYIYSGAQLVAAISGSTTSYQHPDHLSVRVSTDVNGNPVRTFGHYPFGEVWYETGTASKWKFTSYERDAESGNDYALARIYANRQGRFLSPDPLLGSLSNPQSLNRYAYALNNPVGFVDPQGLDVVCLTDIDGSPVSCYDSTVVTADPIDGNSGGGGGGTPDRLLLMLDDGSGGGSTEREKKFKDCLQKFGDQYAKRNLDLQGFDAAIAAAGAAGIDASAVFSLWENENKLNPSFGPVGPRGEVGPIQVRPGVVKELKGAGVLPAGWNSNLQANLTAGALYYDRLVDHYHIPNNQAAAAYNGGPYGYKSKQAQGYQAAFDASQSGFKDLINCMH